jgi:hypothetical protein
MNKRKKGSYIRGSTIVRDSGWRGRVAHRVKMTKSLSENIRRDYKVFGA